MKKGKVNRAHKWCSVFAVVMENYEILQGERDSRGGLSHPPPGRVGPCISDFLCDVELAARSVLNKAELDFFLYVYVKQEEVPPTVRHTSEFKNTDHRVMKMVGRELIRRGIYPVHKYMAPKSIERKAS